MEMRLFVLHLLKQSTARDHLEQTWEILHIRLLSRLRLVGMLNFDLYDPQDT